jgi:DNA helicase-2/ATP-dependent DNA helicase PcrA
MVAKTNIGALAAKMKAQREGKKDRGVLAPHIVVDAKAGTGKTTTMIGGLLHMKGQYPGFKPSRQQVGIWETLMLGKKPESIAMVAYNTAIAKELANRVPTGVNASTMHSMGKNAVGRLYPDTRRRDAVNKWKTQNLLESFLGCDFAEVKGDRRDWAMAILKTVSLCKNLLTGWTPEDGFDVNTIGPKQLNDIWGTYDIDTLDEEGIQAVLHILEESLDLDADYHIDFDDMVWLPIVKDIQMFKYDLLMVDEAQDLNPARQQLAYRAGDRIVLVGDPHQAIYGFTGADTESIENMTKYLQSSDRGCLTLPLNVTFRCGKAIVAAAQKLVPEFFAHETNGEGEEREVPREKLVEEAQSGDMVLCRTNAPLVSAAFRFITAGKKATIVGGDIGAGLKALIRKLKPNDVVDLMDKVEKWHDQENAKLRAMKNPNENKLMALADKRECIIAFCEDAQTLAEVTRNIDKMFVEDTTSGIRMSSIHRSKGLEADRVFILNPQLIPHPMAKSDKAKKQEWNLKYVGMTRPKNLLAWVSG